MFPDNKFSPSGNKIPESKEKEITNNTHIPNQSDQGGFNMIKNNKRSDGRSRKQTKDKKPFDEPVRKDIFIMRDRHKK